jgi:hypothetical protein
MEYSVFIFLVQMKSNGKNLKHKTLFTAFEPSSTFIYGCFILSHLVFQPRPVICSNTSSIPEATVEMLASGFNLR